jgi:asparagine synthetase B (glutamine-hydrolysing)
MSLLAYLGKDKSLRDAVRKLAVAERNPPRSGVIYQDDHLILVDTARRSCEPSTCEIDPVTGFYLEGHANSESLAKEFRQGFDRQAEHVVRDLHGVFNLIAWDPRANNGFIANDRMGLDPLYLWHGGDSSFMAATQLSDILSATGISREIDRTAVCQFGLFNYILGRRTFLRSVTRLPPASIIRWENGNVMEKTYWQPVKLFREPLLSQEELFRLIPDRFLTVLSEWTRGHKEVGILLSGGYDSRMVLAGLVELGIKGKAFTWNNPAVKETGIAKKLAESAGFRHSYLPYDPPEEITEQLIHEAQETTGYIFPLFHVGRYHAVRLIGRETDIVFSGQGELIRVTAVPNDYLNRAALNLMVDQDPLIAAGDSYIETGLCPRPDYHNEEFLFPDCTRIERMCLYLLSIAYRHDYGILRYGESRNVPVAMPMLDPRIIELLLTSPLSIARRKTWKKNLKKSVETRRIYLSVIKKFAPDLMNIPWDRGYPPAWDLGYRGYFMTALWGVKTMLNLKYYRTQHRPTPWRRYVQGILSEDRTLARPFFKRDKIVQSLKKSMRWDPVESYELEKAARLELWLRNHIESIP